MILVENIGDWRGQDVIDPTGEKLGKLEEIFYDGETDDPAFAAVKSGLVSKSLTFVPFEKASVGRDYVRLNHDKNQFKQAPSYDTGTELSLDDEAAIYGYFGREYTPAGTGSRRLGKR